MKLICPKVPEEPLDFQYKMYPAGKTSISHVEYSSFMFHTERGIDPDCTDVFLKTAPISMQLSLHKIHLCNINAESADFLHLENVCCR